MAKKKTSQKGAPKRRATKQTKREAERVLRKGPIRRTPRSQPLPGMEDARIGALDDIAHSIADVREQKNKLANEEKQLLATALKLLREHKRTIWKHNGVELVLVPGEEKVRARLVKGEARDDEDDQGDLDPMDAEETDDVAMETGASADA